jgi:hypothetical protein
MSEEQPSPPEHRLARRQTLGIAGAAGAAVVLGGLPTSPLLGRKTPDSLTLPKRGMTFHAGDVAGNVLSLEPQHPGW